ncbi:MAG: Na/Pi cotransporter family protein [Planctomycetota bacterium]
MLALATVSSLDVGAIVMTVVGGLALFLYGMDQMTDALKFLAGDRMKSALAKLTGNRVKGIFAGAFVTSIIQSSSVTTVLVVGFISAGLMTFRQSIGVILGADIGTTVTAQIVAFKVTQYALVLVSIGFAMLFASRREWVRQFGHMVMGLGLIFFGMHLMGEGTSPLRDYEPFIRLMQQMDNPLMAILVSALFTGLIQSSSATIGVVIVLASQGLVSLETGVSLVFGANIGTCITAVLASIGKPREAVRAALVHILFKIVGVLIWIAFIDQLAELSRWMSPSKPELEGLDRLAADTPRQIANVHTIFNVANTLIFVGFVTPIEKMMYRIVPEPEVVTPKERMSKHLDPIVLRTPALALDIVRVELGRLGASALHMVRESLDPVLKGPQEELDRLQAMDVDVDDMHAEIVAYLGRLSKENLTDHQSELLHDYLAEANYFESIADMIQTNLVEAGSKRVSHHVEISPATEALLAKLHMKTVWSVAESLGALVESNRERARDVLAAKKSVNSLADDAGSHLATRLAAEEPNRMATFRIESDIIETLKRIYYFAKRIARVVAEADVTDDRDDPPSETTEAT